MGIRPAVPFVAAECLGWRLEVYRETPPTADQAERLRRLVFEDFPQIVTRTETAAECGTYAI